MDCSATLSALESPPSEKSQAAYPVFKDQRELEELQQWVAQLDPFWIGNPTAQALKCDAGSENSPSIPSLKQKTSQIAENAHPSCNDGSNAAPITKATVKKCSSGALNSHLEIEDPFVSMKTSSQCVKNDKNGLKVARQSQNHQLKSDGVCSYKFFLSLNELNKFL